MRHAASLLEALDDTDLIPPDATPSGHDHGVRRSSGFACWIRQQLRANQPPTYKLYVSSSPIKSSMYAPSGASLSGLKYVFVSSSNDDDIDRVIFLLDGKNIVGHRRWMGPRKLIQRLVKRSRSSADLRKVSEKRYLVGLVTCVLFVTTVLAPASTASAAPHDVVVAASNPTPGAMWSYNTWSWSGFQTVAPVQCITVALSNNADGSVGKPTGLVLGNPSLDGNYLGGSWTVDTGATASGILVWNNAVGFTPAGGNNNVGFSVQTQPTTPGGQTVFVIMTTYDAVGNGSSGTCAGSILDGPTVAAYATEPVTVVSGTIDPSLTFTVAAHAGACNGVSQTGTANATTVNLGHLVAGSTEATAQDLTVATNAANGFTLYLRGSPFASSAHTMTTVSGTNAAPSPFDAGEAFGYTTSDTNVTGFGGPKWAALSTTNSAVMTNASVATSTKCVAFQVSTTATTPAGLYSTAITYTAVPAF